MTFQERITASASRHTQLLQSLEETSYAPAAAQQNAALISELQVRIPTETKNIEKLEWKVEKERSEYEEYRDAHVKRFASKLVGKRDDFDAKANKEESEYREVLETQSRAKSNLKAMQDQLKEAQQKQPELELAAANYAISKSELATLSESIFSLPHAPVPSENTATVALQKALTALHPVQGPFDTASQTQGFLINASKYLTWALDNTHRAINKPNPSPLDYGPAYGLELAMALDDQGRSTEKSAMAQAQSHAAQAQMLLESARRLQPGSVRGMTPIVLAQKDFLGTAGKPFNEFQFRQKMVVAEKDLQRAREEVEKDLEAARARLSPLKAGFEEAKERVLAAEEGLQKVRTDVWERVVRGEDFAAREHSTDSHAAPPEYRQ